MNIDKSKVAKLAATEGLSLESEQANKILQLPQDKAKKAISEYRDELRNRADLIGREGDDAMFARIILDSK